MQRIATDAATLLDGKRRIAAQRSPAGRSRLLTRLG